MSILELLSKPYLMSFLSPDMFSIKTFDEISIVHTANIASVPLSGRIHASFCNFEFAKVLEIM